MVETTAAQIEKLHITHSVRAEMLAATKAVDVGSIEGTGAIVYKFADGSNICFLGTACFESSPDPGI